MKIEDAAVHKVLLLDLPKTNHILRDTILDSFLIHMNNFMFCVSSLLGGQILRAFQINISKFKF